VETINLLIEKLGNTVKTDFLLASLTTYKIGGPADYFFEATSQKELAESVLAARDLNIPCTILGGGTNILISDKGIRGLVIKNSARAITLRGIKGVIENGKQKGNVYVEAESGTPVNQLVRFTIEEGLAGLETHLGLPGTVGGAVYINAKWAKTESYIGDAVSQASILTPGNTIQTVSRQYFSFAYDTSVIQKTGDIVLSVVFELQPANKEALWKIANESVNYRRESQPQGILSAGCVFRNISKAVAISANTPGHVTSAGFLIDHAGLKGKRIGEAEISSIHANFITNLGHARAIDVLELIKLCKTEVKKQFNIDLIEEIVILGDFS
jgi:UDP-N-acetylenolpyruvoylglucosamine reductase